MADDSIVPENKMKAIVYRQATNDPHQLTISVVDKPVPKADEILIEVYAFGLNFADTMARKGEYPDAPAFPFVPGYEVCGIIQQIGEQAIQEGFTLKVGDKVLALTMFGGYAEYAVAPYQTVLPLPEGLSFVQGASLPVNACTAYHGLFYTGVLAAGDRVLIHAAAGGVGQIAVQLAKNAGCEVFGTAGTAEKLAYLRDNYGLDHGINYVQEDFSQSIRRTLNQPKGKCLDVIMDPVGGTQFKSDLDLLRSNGRLIAFGVSSISNRSTFTGFFQAIPKVLSMLTVNMLDLMKMSKTVVGLNMLQIAKEKPLLITQSVDQCLNLIKEGKLRTVVSQELDWSQIGQAQAQMEQRQTSGKIVLVIKKLEQ